jgi:hypothetical protein
MLRFSENAFWRVVGWARSVVWRFAWRPGRFTHGKELLVPIEYEAGLAPKPVWTVAIPGFQAWLVQPVNRACWQSCPTSSETPRRSTVSTALLRCRTVNIRLRTMRLWFGIAAVVLGRICVGCCCAVCSPNQPTLSYDSARVDKSFAAEFR